MLKIEFRSERKSREDILIQLPSSKSISNRLSIINALSEQPLPIIAWSEADDALTMQSLLKSREDELDVGMAGTAMRFLTAYHSLQKGREVVLKGDQRMHERPIGPLVAALRQLGAEISYLDKEGYPPLKIKGQPLDGSSIAIDASYSSQYVTALLLIAPYLKNGLEMNLQRPTSQPYIQMTTSLMQKCGIILHRKDDRIDVEKGTYQLNSAYQVEADWSSAAFFYQFFALSKLEEIKLNQLQDKSIQGDRKCVEYFQKLGVATSFHKDHIQLSKTAVVTEFIDVDMTDHPDLILPFVFAAVFLCKSVHIHGIQTLRLKESDRVKTLLTELQKLAEINYQVNERDLRIRLIKKKSVIPALQTHGDHRVAMSVAATIPIFNTLKLDDEKVVNKSFPNFWKELSKMGVVLKP